MPSDMTASDPNQPFALPAQLDLWQQTLNWRPNPEQQALYQRLYQEILSGNQQFNLTRITEPEAFWEKHLWDSLRGIQAWLAPQSSESSSLSNAQVIDVGTGAGFPGVPVAIACPQWQVTLLDSTHKKVAFLETLLTKLELSTTKTIVARAEQFGQTAQHRESYDIALIRAVAAASICAEYTLPLLKVGGVAVLYRGQWLDQETEALQTAVDQLGGEIEQIESFVTPLSQSVRHCLYLRKIKPTNPAFPRSVGVPSQKPL
jgi:16S rRNA (guanine527-N7)-methyltransferase